MTFDELKPGMKFSMNNKWFGKIYRIDKVRGLFSVQWNGRESEGVMFWHESDLSHMDFKQYFFEKDMENLLK